MAPKFPLFTNRIDLTLIKTLWRGKYNLGKKIPILVTTVSRQALDLRLNASACGKGLTHTSV